MLKHVRIAFCKHQHPSSRTLIAFLNQNDPTEHSLLPAPASPFYFVSTSLAVSVPCINRITLTPFREAYFMSATLSRLIHVLRVRMSFLLKAEPHSSTWVLPVISSPTLSGYLGCYTVWVLGISPWMWECRCIHAGLCFQFFQAHTQYDPWATKYVYI